MMRKQALAHLRRLVEWDPALAFLIEQGIAYVEEGQTGWLVIAGTDDEVLDIRPNRTEAEALAKCVRRDGATEVWR